jgi:hypothetical protein
MERPLRDISSALRHADKNGVTGTKAQKNNRRAGGHRHDNSRSVDTNEILGEAGKALRAPEQQPKKGPKVLSQCYKGCLGSNRECQLPESR